MTCQSPLKESTEGGEKGDAGLAEEVEGGRKVSGFE